MLGRVGTIALIFAAFAGGIVARPFLGDIYRYFTSRHKAAVVMIGDSLTGFFDLPALFPGVSIANRGVVGATSEQILNSIDRIKSTGAKKAFLMLGINDFIYITNSTPGSAFANYQKIIERVESFGMHPYVQSTLATTLKDLNVKVEELNRLLAAYCLEPRCTYIDLAPAIFPNGSLRNELASDFVHINERGYKAWRDAISPYIKSSQSDSRRTDPASGETLAGLR